MSDKEYTEKQEKIIKTAKNNPDASNKEIAEKSGASRSYVSQTLNNYDPRDEDQVNNNGGDGIGWLLLLIGVGAGIYFLSNGGTNPGGNNTTGLISDMLFILVETQLY